MSRKRSRLGEENMISQAGDMESTDVRNGSDHSFSSANNQLDSPQPDRACWGRECRFVNAAQRRRAGRPVACRVSAEPPRRRRATSVGTPPPHRSALAAPVCLMQHNRFDIVVLVMLHS
ncbi:hypothetical protein RR46_10779 [Papilio xuthus]|uniref:Uncharacterized protein n=1 Tax=Papilio xuthus TaxID=66420 RepID=A0A194PLA8_PAPXU|nr:hypothetical protein RR46_10779 [Papilio xuthus]